MLHLNEVLGVVLLYIIKGKVCYMVAERYCIIKNFVLVVFF